MPIDRPRVRAEGPGGPDIKQGARIACLDCRSAKIRCSAPTDGKVPCKRCARHGRECVFEKHRRGRKPGRTNNTRPGMHGLHDMSGGSGSSGSSSDRSLAIGMAYGGGAHAHGPPPGAMPSQHSVNYDSAMATSSKQDTHASSPYTQSYPGNSAWRPPLSFDDPRLVSPRHGPPRKLSSQAPPLPSSSSTFVHSPSFGRAPSSLASLSPRLREPRLTHPSYLSYGSSSGADHTGSPGPSGEVLHGPPVPHASTRSTPSSPFQASAYGLRHTESSPLDLHLGAGRFAGHQQMGSGSARREEDLQGTSLRAGSSGGPTPYNTASRYSETSFSPPSSGLPPSSLGSVATPGRSWLDFPTPGVRSLLSPSHLMTTTIGTFPSSAGSLPTVWPGSAITSPHSKRRGPLDYFSGAVSQPDVEEVLKNHESQAVSTSAAQTCEEARKKRRVEQGDEGPTEESSADPSGAGMRLDDDEEQIDQMGEDEVGGAHDGDVLSTPLRLLAHASDAALALRQAKGDADGRSANQRSTSHGAATMGLLSPPLPALPAPRRWIDSGRLPSMSEHRSAVQPLGLLPRLTSVAQRRDLERSAAIASSYDQRNNRDNLPSASRLSHAPRGPFALPPPDLGSSGRSRSYTAVEAASGARSSFLRSFEQGPHELNGSLAIIVKPVTHSERRAEVLGIHTDKEGFRIENGASSGVGSLHRSMTPSTLDPDAWEYRDGRVRSRKSISAGPSTSTGTHTGSGSTADEERATTLQQQGIDDAGAARVSIHTDAMGVETSLQRNEGVAFDEQVAQGDTDADDKDVSKLAHLSTFRSRLGSMDAKPRWEVVRRRLSKPVVGLQGFEDTSAEVEEVNSVESSDESEKQGASHQDFFSMSIFHSKMDNDIELDPVEMGLLQLRELEKLFDIFFARVNPLLTMLDPFLHSVTYVRNRSALLTTVIAALAARLSDAGRNAKLAVVLENHWRQKLLPEALLGGYKSVEISQAFLVLAIYHKPINRLSEDRSWQYLGFAIRIATEIGVNRLTQPSDAMKDNEQVRRRMRNRIRLWISLWLTDRSFSLQTGRPFTISEDDLIAHSDLWHRQDFALPEDARLVSLVKLMRIATDHCNAFTDVIGQHSVALVQDPLTTTSAAAISQSHESIKSLNFRRLQAITELERWKDIWCVEALDESSDGIQSLAIGTFLVNWRPRAVIDLLYARLHLNSIVLEAMERHQRLMLASRDTASTDEQVAQTTTQVEETVQMSSKVALDCWNTSLRMIDLLLGEIPDEDLSAGPNALAVNVIYGALAALRLSNAGQRASHHSWFDREVILKRCRALADALIKAGRTPSHRNGSAAPFGTYLQGIVTLWETENVGLSDSAALQKSLHDGAPTNETNQSRAGPEAGKDAVGLASPVSLTGFRGTAQQRSLTEPDGTAKPVLERPVSDEQVAKPLQTAPPTPGSKSFHGDPTSAHHSVGDEIWGTAFSQSTRHARSVSGQQTEAETMDRMWDYMTTYPDAVSTFPMSLWQPQVNVGSTSAFVPSATMAVNAAAMQPEAPSVVSDAPSSAAVAAAAAAANLALNMANVARPSAV